MDSLFLDLATILQREIDAGGVDQIDDRNAIAHGNFLRTENLGDRFGPPGTRLHGSVVGDDDSGAAFHAADAGDDTRGWGLPFITVVGDQQADLEERRPRVEQTFDALARGHLSGAVLALDAGSAATLAEAGFERSQLVDEQAHVRLAGYVHGHFSGEKSVGSMKTESTCWTILPSASDAADTFFHSGSSRKAAQLALAASRLGCFRM